MKAITIIFWEVDLSVISSILEKKVKIFSLKWDLYYKL